MAGGRAVLAAVAALGAGTATIAQNPGPSDSIVVFAEKRLQPLEDVPMAVATLTGPELDAGAIEDLKAGAARLPVLGFQSTVSAATTTLRIRRVGNLGNIPTFEPAVGLFVDGAFRSRSMLGAADLLDIERIEVLSGPQSTLYGKNASAGVVGIYTREPGDVLSAIGEATLGSIDAPGSPDLGRLEVSVAGPLSTTWRGGIAAAHSWHGHTLANALPGGPDGNDQSRSTFRGQLSWRPSERLKMRLIAGYSRTADDEGESDVFFAPGARSTAVADALRQRGLTPGCPDNVPRNRISCATAANTLDLEASDFTVIGEYGLGNGWRLTSVTGWDRYRDRRNDDDTMQLSVPLLYFHDSEEGTTLQQELRATSSDSAKIPWLAGLFYYENDYERGTRGERPMFGPQGPAAFDPVWQSLLPVPLALPGQQGLMDSRLHTNYLGVFGQLTWKLGERLSVTSGLRWQREEKNAALDNATTLPGASLVSTVLTPAVSPNGDPVNGALSRLFDGWTWSITPAYRVGDGLMLYATWARGAKSGGFNTGFGNIPLAAREFGDERVDDYEIGARASFADDRARLGAAVFYTRYHDYQDAAFASAQFTIGNAARVDLKGAELEGRFALGPRTGADLGVSFADLTYARNTTGMCYPGRTPDGTSPGSCDLSGEHPLDAPEWVARVGVEHTRPLGAMQLFGRLDWSWTDSYNTSFSADPRLVQPPAHQVDVRLGLRFRRYEVVLAAENLLNEKIVYVDSVLNFFNDASYQSFLDEARRYTITFRTER
ncbi:MAG TPA: TonB-dependent receptor [Gammaproteobacteria bacterium]|nr:TonB-dependent receptor [Gammaproteobacteria bacterium]